MPLRIISIILCSICLFAGCLKRRPYEYVDKKRLKGSGVVYLVPLGDFPSSTTDRLADYYLKHYGIDVKTLPKIELTDTVKNKERKQLNAEELVTLMKDARPELVHDPKAFVIGLTSEDMYIEHRDWQYAYSWRQEGKYAVVSSNRMNVGGIFKGVSDEQIHVRLRKMVTKNIGLLYYRLPSSDDPRSVLYGRVDGMRDLDNMGEEF